MALGGRRPGAGRPKGSKNRANKELRDLARTYTNDALDTLAHIAQCGESESARVQASVALLDRAWGKPKAQIESDMNNQIRIKFVE
jgi:hypothetical protein